MRANPWLTLTGATDNFGGRDAWDINSGPSAAYHNLLGAVPSESFTITGCCGPPYRLAGAPSKPVLLGWGFLYSSRLAPIRLFARKQRSGIVVAVLPIGSL